MMNARQVAVKVISEIERDGSYSNIASDNAIKEAKLSRVDAALASMLIYGVLQRKITLDFVLCEAAGKNFKKTHPFVLSVLRVAAYQLLFMDKIPPSAAVNEAVKIVKSSKQRFAQGFVNAVLRKVINDKIMFLEKIEAADDLSVKYSCSKEFADCLIADYGRDVAEGFLKASLESPKLYCRVNNFAVKDGLFDRLTEKGITVERGSVDGAFSILGAGNVENLPEFQDGEFFVQDLASQIAISQFGIADSESVLDVCAAPGGKSFTAAQYIGNNGKILSCDLYEKRVGLIKNGSLRLNIKNLEAKQNDATVFNPDFGLFDRVICDVPCSGFGVIRRKPEIKYKNLSEFSDLHDIQFKILQNAACYLKENGVLMYSTCTVRNAENRAVVDEFLKSHNDFKIVSERTLMPHIDGCDGFYFCILKRR